MSEFEKFEEELPSKETFYSLLTSTEIRDKEYEHILKVWNRSEMKTMEDYHELSLECDALFLADVFQIFRNTSLKNYGLSPSHYLSAPALSCDAMINMIKAQLEFIPDADMYLVFEKG